MRITRLMRLSILCLWMSGCGSSSMPGSTVAPTTVTPTSAAAPTITAISPALGSIGGTTRIAISGTGLSRFATASFGGAAVTGGWDPRHLGTMMTFYTQAHAAETVDVIVTNPDGQSARLSAAYTFVSAQSFDFNGDFYGFPNNGQDIPIRFTVQSNMLLTVSCDDVPAVARTFSPPLPLTNGEFSFVRDGVKFSGRMVAASEASGTIKLGPCESNAWDADRQ
jgi:hypothetical protein